PTLGEDLVLRRATPADAEAVTAFVADVLRGQDSAEPSPAMGAWVHDLLSGHHPVVRAGDCRLITDTAGGIVSCATLIAQEWSFGGVAVGVGQPELIGTRTGYRGRRLVSALMDAMHRDSAARGHHLQAITGIPWFYRQFGYEFALERGGGPSIAAAELEHLDPDAAAAYRVRPAQDADAPFLVDTDAHAARRSLVTARRDERRWRYEIAGRSEPSSVRRRIDIVEAPNGERAGYVAYGPRAWRGAAVQVVAFEVAAGVSWLAVWIPLLAHLKAHGEAVVAREGKRAFGGLDLWLLGSDHPIRRVSHLPAGKLPYAFYVRVPDLAAFVRRVAPVLERRLAGSALVGHTGELRLGFFRDGLRLAFERGRLAAAEAWTPSIDTAGVEFAVHSGDQRRPHAMFPPLTFLQLLFGYRSLDDLERAFADCVVRTVEARSLLNALFPAQPSCVNPVV
ncbi:MAG TPA: GNAT family N-acetyltransferase, partial [Candidatus Limnocylindria bacterium]|nr:GNAT family N-acetyltransferase [Candidatus Limnocylindria bacterium]